MRQLTRNSYPGILDLKELGKGIPVIEKNTRCLLSFIHALKFGISDVADVSQH